MRKIVLTGVAVLGLAAIGFASIGSTSTMQRAEAEGSGADVRANSHMVAMNGGYANRAESLLVAEAEGSGADVRAMKLAIMIMPSDTGNG